MMIAKKHRRLCLATVLIGLAILCLVLFKPEPAQPTAKHSDLHDHSSHPCNHAKRHKQNRPSSRLIRNASAKPTFRPLTAKHHTGITAAETNYAPWTGQTNTAFRARAIIPAELLTSGSPMEKGVRFSLPLFDDYTFSAIVQDSFVNVNGTVSTLAHSEDSDWARAAIAYTDGELRVKILDPENHRAFAIHYNHNDGYHYALELDMNLLNEHEKCGLTHDSPFRNPPREQASQASGAREQVQLAPRAVVDESVASALIDVMVVYSENTVTQAGSENTILNIAAQGIALSNDVHQVSDTGMVIRLVHTEKLTGYIDSGSNLLPGNSNYQDFPVNNIELPLIRGTSDGTNDHIHGIRDQVGADFVCMLTTDPFGGLGTVSVFSPGDSAGEPDTAFNVNGWSVFDSYVPVHELGHNMGLEHSKFQAVSKGNPDPTTGSYAAGWYWHVGGSIANDGYSSIMSYDEHFDDHANTNPQTDPFHLGHAEVGLFSNTVPEFQMFGQPTGHATHADARRAIRERRAAFASYRTRSTLNDPELALREPNAAASWPIDTTQIITWDSRNVSGKVKLELYRSGIHFQDIAATTINDGVFYWQIPASLPQGADYKIRISSLQSPSITDVSTSEFIISEVIYHEPMNVDPGYGITGTWEFGTPTLTNAIIENVSTGTFANFGGPEAARTGTTIYDTNLAGGSGPGTDQHLTSIAVNCAQFENCRLVFYGQLGITENTTALVEVSNDNSSWTQLFATTDVAQSGWERYELDASAVADKKSTVFFRWSLIHSGGSFQSGFAIDDVSVIGNAATRITYNNTKFTEANTNDGSIENTIVLTLSAETFTGSDDDDLIANGKASITNLPAGLTATLIRTSSTQAVLSLPGTATANEKDDDVNNLTVSFSDTAFSGGDANAVIDSTRDNLLIDFFTHPPHSLTFTAGANGTIDNPETQLVEKGDDAASVRAIPNANHHFVNWTGSFTSTDNPITITDVQSDISLTANFAVGQGNFPYIESFESGLGIWSNRVGIDDHDWNIEVGPSEYRDFSTEVQQGQFVTGSTGPERAFSERNYISLIDNDGENESAVLEATFSLLHTTSPALHFAYNMFGFTVNELKVEVSNNDGATYSQQLLISGNQGDAWHLARVDLSAFRDEIITIRLAARSPIQRSFEGTISVDAIMIFDETTHAPLIVPESQGGRFDRQGIQVVPLNTSSSPLRAIPDAGFTFKGWVGNGNPQSNPLVIPSVNNLIQISPRFLNKTYPYSESFETNLGLWHNTVGSDELDWERERDAHVFRNNNTGPSSAQDGDFYVSLLDGTPASETGILQASMSFESLFAPELTFHYHMFGTAVNNLKLEASINKGNSWTELWSRSGNQGDTWHQHQISLLQFAGEPDVTFRFFSTMGVVNFTSTVTIDNLSIVETAGKLSFTPKTFMESAVNDGSIDNSVAITLENKIFSQDVVSANRVAVTNLPAGLSADFLRDSDTQLTLSLTGTATDHANSADILDVTVTFDDDAFENSTASTVRGSTTSDFIIDFRNPDPLSVNIVKNSISENSEQTTCTISRPGTAGTIVVNLSSAPSQQLTTPNTVTISNGETTSTSFIITAFDDSNLDGDQTVQITASAQNYVSGSDSVIVTDDSVQLNVVGDPVDGGTQTATTLVDPEGGPFLLSASPAAGFGFDQWTTTGGQIADNASSVTSIDGLSGDVTVTATFVTLSGAQTLTATATVAGQAPEIVHFGIWDQTTPGFDANVDALSEDGARIWLIDHNSDSTRKLRGDYQPPATNHYWHLVVAPGSEQVELEFDVSDRPGSTIALLQPSNGDLAIAPAVNLASAQSTTVITKRSEFLIAVGPSLNENVTLERGWNWLGIPLISEAELDDFLAPAASPLYFGNRHTINHRGRLIQNTGAILPEIGTLVYSLTGGPSEFVSGIRPDGIVDIHRGWNPITLPDNLSAQSAKHIDILDTFQIFSWSPTRRRYKRVTPTDDLNRNQTYLVAPRDHALTRYNFSATTE